MRILKLFLPIFVASTLLLSCDKNDDNISYTNDYLPLEVSNYWKLDYLGKREIVGTKEINNKTYYLLQYQDDTIYYSIENNKVYVIDSGNNESIKFDLSAKVNDTWNFNSYTVKLVSKTDTVIINNTKIINCYQFYFDVPVMVDEEHSIWLAPGIGFIQEQCGECLYQIKKLNKAKIGGQEIEYTLNTTGIIKFLGEPAVDGCGWVIQISDKNYKPQNLPEEYNIDNLEVEIKYNLLVSKSPCGFSEPIQEIYIEDIWKE